MRLTDDQESLIYKARNSEYKQRIAGPVRDSTSPWISMRIVNFVYIYISLV